MIEQEAEEEWHPVAFSSRALNTSEQNYAQIEHETLSVVFGCERFHEYVYGRQFIIQNDHKPLKSIFSKSIIQCPHTSNVSISAFRNTISCLSLLQEKL